MSNVPEYMQATGEESPYGLVGARLGLAALRAFDDLGYYPDWRGGTRRRWMASDHRAFRSTMNAVSLADMAGLANDTYDAIDLLTSGVYAADERGDSVKNHVDRLHKTLPFSEAERQWLVFTMYVDARGVSHETPADEVRLRSTTQYDAGRERTIRGRDLLDAWWAWERDAFEFEGQGSIEYARWSLRGLGRILVPEVTRADYRYRAIGYDDIDEARRIRKAMREGGIDIARLRVESRAQRLQTEPKTSE
ncbi:MAG TPA: hypothetical protein VG147_07955 [Solirubrobacteraceae bacterium]|jgi:hypothetical protein|nr:hypothetical protein [Solirubrobacteraceae bacterium]